MDVLAFDIESADADLRFTYGTGFVRLCGWAPVGSDDITISSDPDDLIQALNEADAITAHNGIDFDLQALAYWHGADYHRLCKKVFDTLLGERHLNPVAARGKQPNGYYKLDAVARRYGGRGKSTVDVEGKREILRRVRGDKYADRWKPGKETEFGVLTLLKDEYGGYDKIPLDDPDYQLYLRYDVLAQQDVFTAQSKILATHSRESRAYLRREHYVQRDTGFVTIIGARVNRPFTERRHAEGQARLSASQQMLAERFGMPTEGKKPHTTNAGKAAFRDALVATGISRAALDRNWPKDAKGYLLTGKEVLKGMIDIFERTGRTEAVGLCRTILAMNGERSIYSTFLKHTGPDGKVHPSIRPEQSSGRWSMQDPGVTVAGKRGGKAVERNVILPDTDDEVLVAIDADQVDARGIAGLSQDPEYMKLFQPGVDLHSEVAFRVWSSPAQHGADCHQAVKAECECGIARKCHCEKRDRAKVFGHGWNYGMGAKGMAAQHGVDVRVAYEFVAGMERAFPVLCAWKDEMRALAGAVPYGEEVPENDSYRILYTGFGRPVRVERSRAYTQATAQLGQGTTRDIMAEALLKLPLEYRRRVRAIVHDEFVLSLPKENAQQVAQQIADSMAFVFRGVAITFGCSRVGRTWAGCYGEQYEMVA